MSEGCGARQTGHLVGASTDTVLRYSLRAGEHAQQLHDELVAFSPQTREVQFNEKWSLVGKKEKHCDPFDPQGPARQPEGQFVSTSLRLIGS